LTEVHRVQVPREDLKLREPVLELPCQERLVDLPAEALVVAGVQVLHQLLGDRRAALDDVSAPKIVDRGPQDRLGVDAMMGVEASVLDRDDGVSDVLRHLDRKSTRLNSSHQIISYAVFCLKKKKKLPAK